MEIRQPLIIDLARPMPMVPVAAVQGDGNTRILEITLLENGATWQIPGSAVVDVAFRKPDGTKGIYSKLPDGSSATSRDGNVLSATLAPQMLTCPGAVLATVVFRTEGGKTLAAFPFTVKVEANPAAGAEISEDYFNPENLSDLRAELAAGLATKAPDGHGLGTNTVNQSTIDGMTQNGFYHGSITEPATGYSGNTYGVHIQYSDKYAYQELLGMKASTGITEGTVRRRYKDNGTWGEIEYVNPPMVLGVEYRTTERYLGKPVYAKVIDFGSLPVSTSKKVDTKAYMKTLIRFSLIGANDATALNGFPGLGSVYNNTSEIIITTTSDLSAFSAYVALWYIKE